MSNHPMIPLEVHIGEFFHEIIMQFLDVWGINSSAKYFIEQLLEAGLADSFRDEVVLDIGCGTGIMGLFAIAMGAKCVYFVDIHGPAIENVRLNAKLLGLTEGVHFFVIQSDVYSGLPDPLTVGVIMGNVPMMPYSPGVHDDDPAKKSNQNGPNGNHVLLSLLRDAPKYLKEGGLILSNCSSRQGFVPTEIELNRLYSWSYINNDGRGINQPLTGDYYAPFLDFWRKETKKDGFESSLDVFPRIYKLDQYGNPIVVFQEGGEKRTIFFARDLTGETTLEKKYILIENDILQLICLNNDKQVSLTEEMLLKVPMPVDDTWYHNYRIFMARMNPATTKNNY